MSWKSNVASAFALGVLLAAGSGAMAADAAAPQAVERAKVCMTQDQVQEKAGIAHTYEGKTYYLCCPMCVKSFDGAPERYSKAHDPVNGQVVDKATAPVLGYRGQAYFFASDESRAAFQKEPDRYVDAAGH